MNTEPRQVACGTLSWGLLDLLLLPLVLLLMLVLLIACRGQDIAPFDPEDRG